MKSNKLKLNDLKVKSFVTEIEKTEEVKGGLVIETIDFTGCTRFSCGIKACTENILNCF
ncbi:MAG: pinensin family lanthipeptide [Bacteroidota bacterium]